MVILSLARTAKPDMVVLDIRLPNLDGWTLRVKSNLPIIMLTARAGNRQKTGWHELGG
jgi:two-component system response regulator AdeR